MLTISTSVGTYQWHRHEFLTIRCGNNEEARKVGKWLKNADAVGFKFRIGDEVNLPDHGWVTIIAASWNAAWDRENEAERVRKKASKARKAAAEAEEKRMIDALTSAML